VKPVFPCLKLGSDRAKVSGYPSFQHTQPFYGLSPNPADRRRGSLNRLLKKVLAILPDAWFYLREGDTLLVTKIDRLARSTSDLYRIVSQLAEKGVEFKVIDDSAIDTGSRTLE
jgi:hypothetical protein